MLAGVWMLVAALQALPSRFTLGLIDLGGGSSRVESIDGLRGFLALAVILSHAWSYYDFHLRGLPWNWPHNPFFAQCGYLAVLMFFMITGFLFWSKARVARGLIRVVPLYRNRARRILPLYYLLCACLVLQALVRAHWPLVNGMDVAREMGSLVVPGLHPIGRIADMERFPEFAQTWTLFYEVLFYLALPLVAPFAGTRRRTDFFLAAMLVLLATHRVLYHYYQFTLLSFWAGFVVSELLDRYPGQMARLRGALAGAVAAGALAVLPWVTHGLLTPLSFGVACVAFGIIAAGNDMAGVLTLRGTRLLGTVSYSIYLMHLLVLAIAFHAINMVFPVANIAPVAFCAVISALTFVVTAVSMVSYRFVEYPWLRRPIAPR